MAKTVLFERRVRVDPSAVFVCARDEVPRLARVVPEVARVERVRRSVEVESVEQTHRWSARSSRLPLILRPFIRDDDLEWHEHATWDAASLSMTFWIEVLSRYREAVTASGEARLSSHAEGGEVRLSCRVEVDPALLLTLPRLARGAVAPVAESFLAGLLGDSLGLLFVEAERVVTIERVR